MKKLGVYWSVWHRRPQDYDYFEAMQPSVFKIMDGGPPDYEWARQHLPGSLVIARDWAMSEQHEDMLRDPEGTAHRHADDWNDYQYALGFDRTRTLILGINEPRVWDAGVPDALRRYTIALCDRANAYGLRVGAMQLSVGWPGNNGPDSPPDWSPFYGVDVAIRANNGVLVCHEYWADQGPGENWGWWGGRTLKCPWDVPIVIGECGVEMKVKYADADGNERGWRENMSPDRYASELADYTARMSADPRFLGCCVFASDFASDDWWSFDIEPAYAAIIATPIPDAPEPPQPIPPEPFPPTPVDIETGYVTARAGLNVRSGPATSFPILGTLAYGSTVLWDGSVFDWMHLPQGWVSGEYVAAGAATADAETSGPQPGEPFGPRSPQSLSHPLPGSVITSHFYQHPEAYQVFGLPGHSGTDLAGVPQGEPILACAAGVVYRVDVDAGYGNFVMVAHDQLGAYSLYAHCSEILMPPGTIVAAGEAVALVGSTGNSTGPHLHLEIREMNPDGSYRDGSPMKKGRVDAETWCFLHGLTL